MENKQFPNQEPELLFPEKPAAPVPEPEEELPLIEDLDFADSAAVQVESAEEAPSEEADAPEIVDLVPEQPADVMQETVPEYVPESASSFPEEEPSFVIGMPPEPAAVSFMDRIPEIDEDPATEEPVEEASVQPVVEAAAEADPAMEILRDPEFAPQIPAEEPATDTADQEYRDNLPDESQELPEKKMRKQTDPRPTLKGRPKRKKGEGLFGIPNILVTFVWLALILAIGVTLGRMLWVCAADVLAFGRPDQKVTITVYEADTMEDIIDKLHENGLIRYKSLFSLYADISDAQEDIKPGIYDLNTRYDYHALVNFMSPSSTREVIQLTIPEGYTCRQIFALLEENRVCTALDIASYAADGELSDYWFLEDVQRGSEYCLEGFLFPDTYQFYKNSSPREALEKMLDNFEYRFTDEMRSQIDLLNANVTGGGYGVREIVIVASLIEKESAAPAESAKIASVIYNRLHNWDYPALLNIDAAIVYAQGGDAEDIDTSIDSPYNTYRHTGLTPTPIANPGLSSLKAALNPETTDSYFYVLNPSSGMHQFSTTQAEHDAWIREFYN